MSKEAVTAKKWRDQLGNVYEVEKAARTGRFIAVRRNTGGNRKIAKRVCEVSGTFSFVQTVLDDYAKASKWVEVRP